MAWTKEIIIDALKEINTTPLSNKFIKTHDLNLYKACYRHFRNCEEAATIAGLEFENTRIRWSAEKVIIEIQDKHKNDMPLNDYYANKNYLKLYSAGQRYYGSWKNAVEAANIPYSSIQKAKGNGYWNIDNFKLAVNKIMQSEKINSSYMQKHHLDIYSAGCTLFESWNEALKAIGIEVSDVMLYERWTKVKVIHQIKLLHQQNEDLSYKNMKTNYNPLLKAALRNFESLPKALAACDIDYEQYLTSKRKGYWTKEKIIEEIQSIENNANPLNSGYVMNNYKGFYNTARKAFGTWENAVVAAGYNYNEIRNDILKSSYYGYRFEELLDDLFKELNVSFKKYSCGLEGLRPDYIFNNFKWGDAKLSEWSLYNSDTLEKYKSKINYLWIIFMRGNIKDYMYTDSVRMTHVHLIIKQLPKRKQQKYLDAILNIEDALSQIEE